MNKVIKISLIFFIFIGINFLCGFAEIQKINRLSISIQSGYAKMPNYEGGYILGGTFTLNILRNFAIELSIFRFPGKSKGGINDLSKGSLEFLPIQIGLRLQGNIGKYIIPYVNVGGDYFLNKFKIDSQIKNQWQNLGFDINENILNNFSAHIGGGLDFSLSKYILLEVGAKYCFANTNGEWEFKDNFSGEIVKGKLEKLELNPLIFNIGLKLFF